MKTTEIIYRGFKNKKIKPDKWDIYDPTGAYVMTDQEHTKLNFVKYEVDKLISDNYIKRS